MTKRPSRLGSEGLQNLCRSLPGVTEDMKWGNNLVFSLDRMFAVFDLPEGAPFSFRADVAAFEVLTQQPGIRPAPYFARHHWIQLESVDALPVEETEELLREAHALAAAKLSKNRRRELGLDGVSARQRV